MKQLRYIFAVLIASLFIIACSNDDDDDASQTGTIIFKTTNPNGIQSPSARMSSFTANPALQGDTTITTMTSLKLCIGDVWVSQEEVIAGNADDLTWIKLSGDTNQDIMLFEDYSFSPVEVPAGTYKSIKLTFKNVFYRQVVLLSDNTVVYDLLETMGSWSSPCDANDDSWANTNYFSAGGNHILNAGVFEVASAGELIGGFTIEADRTANLSWRLGAGATGTCTLSLIDDNQNDTWDCGTDHMDIACDADVEYMWDFLVEYED